MTAHNQQMAAADARAEFSTSLTVKGLKPRVLVAVRRQQPKGRHLLVSSFFRLHFFWLFTLLGLTVPYRIWFSRHCDQVRVTVIKTTFHDRRSAISEGWKDEGKD